MCFIVGHIKMNCLFSEYILPDKIIHSLLEFNELFYSEQVSSWTRDSFSSEKYILLNKMIHSLPAFKLLKQFFFNTNVNICPQNFCKSDAAFCTFSYLFFCAHNLQYTVTKSHTIKLWSVWVQLSFFCFLYFLHNIQCFFHCFFFL
ncbi:hypothetical protein XENTR_v10022842 [Xenopus tropicalis]|nr:hypothetical protein XENTR_v10022842 [Xenopus tropicalis]